MVSSPAATPAHLCKNCGESFASRYCPACGQAADTPRLAWATVASDFVAAAFDWENGFLRTIAELTRRPGAMVRAYVRGQRKPYVKPVTFYLVLLGALILAEELLQANVFALAADITRQLKLLPPTKADQAAVLKAVNAFNQYARLIFSALLLPVAASLWLFYRRSGYNFVEVSVLTLYLLGYNLLFSLLNLVLLALPLPLAGKLAALVVVTVVSNAWLVWGVAQFFEQQGWWGIAKAVLAVTAAMAGFGLLSGLVSGALARLAGG